MPIEFSQSLLNWYDNTKRDLPWRKYKDAYRIWISEIMLQQTRADTVIPYFERFIGVFPSLKDFAESQEDQYLKLWEGLGYYSRIRNMHKAAQLIMQDYGGEFPRSFEELLKLPGVGPYTAAAIASIAFNRPVPAIDGNLLRIFARLTCYEENISAASSKKVAFKYFQDYLPLPRPGDFNQALMDLGATVCLANKKPLCENCPLTGFCAAYKHGRQTDFPYKEKKAKPRTEKYTIFVIHYNHSVILRKRAAQGLLANLYEFPNTDKILSLKEARMFVEQLGFHVLRVRKLPDQKHVFSHLLWQMRGYEFFTDQWTLFSNRDPYQKENIKKELTSSFPLSEKISSEYTQFPPVITENALFMADIEDIKEKWPIPSAFSFYKEHVLKNC